MIVAAQEFILKDGTHTYEIRLSREREESDGQWSSRRDSLLQSLPSLLPRLNPDGTVTLVLQLIPIVTDLEFNPGKLTEEELLREFGAVGEKGVKNPLKYEEG